MTTPTHDTFAEMAAAYALGALDRDERVSFERHLDTCAICQREVAELRRVTAGIGLAAEPIAPPESLRTRTLDRALSYPQENASTPGPTRSPEPLRPRDRDLARPARASRITAGRLLAAASLAAAIGMAFYAWSLRSQLSQMQETMTELSERANTLRNNLDEARRESARLSRIIDIAQSPSAIQVNLTGSGPAQNAIGRATFSPGRGMVVTTEGMPALRTGRAYQAWLLVPGRDPMSAGVFSASDPTLLATLPPTLVLPSSGTVTVAITEEPAGGSNSPSNLPPWLAGSFSRR